MFSLSGLLVVTVVWINPPEAIATRIEWGSCNPYVKRGHHVVTGDRDTVYTGPSRCLRLYSLGHDWESDIPTEVVLGSGVPMPPTGLTVQ